VSARAGASPAGPHSDDLGFDDLIVDADQNEIVNRAHGLLLGMILSNEIATYIRLLE
jgi:hypothetical protein